MRLNKPLFIIFILIVNLMPIFQVKSTPVYYGDFTNHTLIEENGLIRVWECYNQTLFYDDNSLGTWTILPTDATFAETTSEHYSGTKSICETITASGGLVTFYPDDMNYSNYDYFMFAYKGNNDGLTMNLSVQTDNSNHYIHTFTDNYSDWALILMEKSSFTVSGSPSWSNIQDYYIFYSIYPSTIPKVMYLDMMGGRTYTYYEVWDGSELKYSRTDLPDINDFITHTEVKDYTLYYVFVIMFALSVGGALMGNWFLGVSSFIISLYVMISYSNYITVMNPILYTIGLLVCFIGDIISVLDVEI